MDRLEALLGRHRLVTVTGPGGSGKTRLAVEVARRLAGRFEDGVWLVELAQIDDPSLVAAAVASVLGLPEHRSLSMAEAVAAGAGRRHGLLVLDNCEHVVDGSAGLCAALLEAGDDLRVLATSREALGVEGEFRFALNAMPVPGAEVSDESVASFDAIELFTERAGRADAGFELNSQSAAAVVELVRRLDGMPLAIELAAAQLDVMGLDDLVAAMKDRFRVLVGSGRGVSGRQASLAATVEWSYRLLDEAERKAFRRLSVFPAPFTLAGAQAAIGGEAAGMVARLVRRSMLVAPRAGLDGRSRYSILETLRVYGRERLDGSGEWDELCQAVATWATTEAERIAAGFDTGATELAAARWMDAEQDNLRDVLDWTLQHDCVLAARLAVALGYWWFLRGRLREGRSLLEQVTAARCVSAPVHVGRLESWSGLLALFSSDFDGAAAHLSKAIELASPLGPSRVLVDSLNWLAGALLNTGRGHEAAALTEQALSYARQLGYASGESFACVVKSFIAHYAGDDPAAMEWAQAANLIDADAVNGDVVRWRILTLGNVSASVGKLEEAASAWTTALELSRTAGDLEKAAACVVRLAELDATLDRRGEARSRIDEALCAFLELGEPLMLADSLEVAAVWSASVNGEAAAVIYGATVALRDQIGFGGNVHSSKTLAKLRRELDADIGPERFRDAERRGALMSLPVAVAYARSVIAESQEPLAGADPRSPPAERT
jgi:predicted ATPase